MMYKHGAIGELILTLLLGVYCALTAFIDEKYIYMVLFLSVCIISLVAKKISSDVCDAINENNGHNRRVDVELCKAIHAISLRIESR